MGDALTLEGLARLAGVAPADIELWLRAGLLAGPAGAHDDRDLERACVLARIVRAGLTVPEVARCGREGTLADELGEYVESLYPDGGATETVVQLAAELGCDADELVSLCDAMGLAASVDRLGRTDADALRTIYRARQAGLPEEALLQIVRVWRDCGDRAAEAALRLFHFYVHAAGPSLAGGASAAEDADASARRIGARLDGLLEPTTVYFFRRGYARALIREMIEHASTFSGHTVAADVPGRMAAAVLFVDLSSFTALAEAMGDVPAAEVLRRFDAVVRTAASDGGGRTVKQIGDAFLLVFPDPTSAVQCALDVDAACRRESRFPAVKCGLTWGDVLYRDGDYVGTKVNLAARLADSADPHQVLLDAAAAAAFRPAAGESVVARGGRHLKGLPKAVEVFEAQRALPDRDVRFTDPVCGMGMEADDVRAAVRVDGELHRFCSRRCQRLYATNPSRYRV